MSKLRLPLLFVIIFIIVSCSSDDFPAIPDDAVIPDTNFDNDNEVFELIYDEIITGSLNNIFHNALISDITNNISRNQPIQISEYDPTNNRIKTNYPKLSDLLLSGRRDEKWFISQNAEAATLLEIAGVDVTNGWISLGAQLSGNFNKQAGASLEFFNPFVNYEIINKSPLFNPYPNHVVEGEFNYIQSGGIIEKSDGTYILLTPVVFGNHNKRSIYYASSKNLTDWEFHNELFLSTANIPFAKYNGNVFSVNNPFRLANGSYLVLLGVQQPNNNYTSAYMIIDENLNILKQPKEIMIEEWNGIDQNSFPLSITKFNGYYRLLFHRRTPDFINREIHEIIVSDLFNALDFNEGIKSSKLIHKGTFGSGYLKGKVDDASYITFNSELYVILGGEELISDYLTSRNREYGLMRWNEGVWKHDPRSPLLVNPVQLDKKYPEYNWAWDHLGGFISPIIKNNSLYIYMAFGTDNPDYYLGGIKVSLN